MMVMRIWDLVTRPNRGRHRSHHHYRRYPNHYPALLLYPAVVGRFADGVSIVSDVGARLWRRVRWRDRSSLFR